MGSTIYQLVQEFFHSMCTSYSLGLLWWRSWAAAVWAPQGPNAPTSRLVDAAWTLGFVMIQMAGFYDQFLSATLWSFQWTMKMTCTLFSACKLEVRVRLEAFKSAMPIFNWLWLQTHRKQQTSTNRLKPWALGRIKRHGDPVRFLLKHGFSMIFLAASVHGWSLPWCFHICCVLLQNSTAINRSAGHLTRWCQVKKTAMRSYSNLSPSNTPCLEYLPTFIY